MIWEGKKYRRKKGKEKGKRNNGIVYPNYKCFFTRWIACQWGFLDVERRSLPSVNDCSSPFWYVDCFILILFSWNFIISARSWIFQLVLYTMDIMDSISMRIFGCWKKIIFLVVKINFSWPFWYVDFFFSISWIFKHVCNDDYPVCYFSVNGEKQFSQSKDTLLIYNFL